jgi:hypothetical protein
LRFTDHGERAANAKDCTCRPAGFYKIPKYNILLLRILLEEIRTEFCQTAASEKRFPSSRGFGQRAEGRSVTPRATAQRRSRRTPFTPSCQFIMSGTRQALARRRCTAQYSVFGSSGSAGGKIASRKCTRGNAREACSASVATHANTRVCEPVLTSARSGGVVYNRHGGPDLTISSRSADWGGTSPKESVRFSGWTLGGAICSGRQLAELGGTL